MSFNDKIADKKLLVIASRNKIECFPEMKSSDLDEIWTPIYFYLLLCNLFFRTHPFSPGQVDLQEVEGQEDEDGYCYHVVDETPSACQQFSVSTDFND